MTFQLWESESATLVGSSATEDAAIAVIRSASEKHGRDAVEAVVLLRDGTRCRLSTIAEGAALAERALSRTSPAA